MLFIAEIGMNHNGNLDLAFELIKQAKLSGADIAKFQLGWRDGEGEINQIGLRELEQLRDWCDYFDIEFMVSVITDEAFNLAKKINLKRYKIASRTVKDNIQLVEKVINEGKNTIISLGMWNGDGLPIMNKNIDYLWCKSKYPATPWDLINMPKDFSNSPYTGYSDHSMGIEIPLIAISRGASIIEKHFTLDRSDTTIRDHALSATPDEFRTLTALGRNIYKNLIIGV
jgi:N,N'-diacetyllegionaminate synthase